MRSVDSRSTVASLGLLAICSRLKRRIKGNSSAQKARPTIGIQISWCLRKKRGIGMRRCSAISRIKISVQLRWLEITSHHCSGLNVSGTLIETLGFNQCRIHHKLTPIQFSATAHSPLSSHSFCRRPGTMTLSSVRIIRGTPQTSVFNVSSKMLTPPLIIGIPQSSQQFVCVLKAF